MFINADGARIYLISCGQKKDADIDVIEAAFAFSLLDDHNCDLKKYRAKIQTMVSDLGDVFETLCGNLNSDDVYVQAKALHKVFHQTYGLNGDQDNYDDLNNIDLCHVMNRQKGLPITLSLLAIGLCRAMGWQADGVNFPGHFIMRLEKDGQRLLVDPFQSCKILEAKDLRLNLKKVMGEYAELSAHYYTPCTNREILLRLQNNLKYRLIDQEHYQKAYDVVEKMQWIAPIDHRLCLDKAVLLARLEQPMAAIDNLTQYLEHVTDPYDRTDAEIFLHHLQNQLN